MKQWLARRNAPLTEFSLEVLQSDEFKQFEELRKETSGRDLTQEFGQNAYEAEVIRIVSDLAEVTNSE